MGWNLLKAKTQIVIVTCPVSIPRPKNTVELGTKSVTYSPNKARQFCLKTIKVSCETSMMAITPNISHTLFSQVWKKWSNPIPFPPPLAEAKAKHHRLNLPEIPIESLPRDIQLLHLTANPSKPSNPTGGVGNWFQPFRLQLGYTNEDRIRNDHQRKEGFKLPSFYLLNKKKGRRHTRHFNAKKANWKRLCVCLFVQYKELVLHMLTVYVYINIDVKDWYLRMLISENCNRISGIRIERNETAWEKLLIDT